MGSIRRVAGALLLLGASVAGWAQDANEAEQKAAFEAARKVQVVGPGSVKLRDQAALGLPAGYTFVPQAEAGRLLRSMGNRAGDNLVGLVFPTKGDGWFAVIRYIHEGHIRDDEARDWNADDLLKSLREGTEAANEDRAKRGIPAIEVTGWAEKPAYDAASHRLVWSASSREKGSTGAQGLGVNYNTYALGREGYLSLNLVTDLDQLGRYKPAALELLGATEFNEGRRYADFDGSTDKVAAYGLAALVAGAAAKKLGLFALLLAFGAKFAKVLVVAAGGAVYGVGKLLGWRKTRNQAAAQAADPAP